MPGKIDNSDETRKPRADEGKVRTAVQAPLWCRYGLARPTHRQYLRAAALRRTAILLIVIPSVRLD